MNGKQHAVLWLGFLLIAVRFFTTGQWTFLKQTTETGGSPGIGSLFGAATGAGSGGAASTAVKIEQDTNIPSHILNSGLPILGDSKLIP